MLIRPFGASDILALSRNPTFDLAAARSKGGFSFPQRDWVYVPAVAYLSSSRRPDALWSAFARAIEGRGMTPWKQERETELRPMLVRFLRLDSASPASFRQSAYARPPRVVTWRDHDLRMPLGLIMETETGIGLRQLWIERMFVRGRSGVHLVLGATLAAAEILHGPISWLETWHLASGDTARYDASDLRATWPRLDRILAEAEGRAGNQRQAW